MLSTPETYSADLREWARGSLISLRGKPRPSGRGRITAGRTKRDPVVPFVALNFEGADYIYQFCGPEYLHCVAHDNHRVKQIIQANQYSNPSNGAAFRWSPPSFKALASKL